MTESLFTQVIIDSHVHYYKSWEISLDLLLSTTYGNLTKNNHGQIHSEKTLVAVCLLDTVKSIHPVKDLLNQLHINKLSDWDISPVENEPFSFWAKCEGKLLLVVTGKQLNTCEGLEVLKVGQTQSLKHGDSLTQMLGTGELGSLTILPWAVGKWLGKRGDIVIDCLEKYDTPPFVLGDNGGRPWFWKNIKPFEIAMKKQMIILSGSDPLPVQNGYLKSGSYGNIIQSSINSSTPWASIVHSLDPKNIINFGELSSSIEFLRNQMKLRT